MAHDCSPCHDQLVTPLARKTIVFMTVLGLLVLAPPSTAGQPAGSLVITSPTDGAVYPRDFAAPTFRWADGSGAKRFRVVLETASSKPPLTVDLETNGWCAPSSDWAEVKARSIGRSALLTVTGFDSAGRSLSSSCVSFSTSRDPVDAQIFYREVPLPVSFAMDNKSLIRWKVGDVSSGRPPRTVLSGMKTCANCHSFSRNAKTLAMDIDFGSDKSTYAIADVGREIVIGKPELIAWNDFRREDGEPTLGFLSSLSSDGRYVLSTVKETIVLAFPPDLYCSQIFFPIRGILALYDRKSRAFRALGGADDPTYVQTNASFSPDGRIVVFARAKAPGILRAGVSVDPEALSKVAGEYQDESRRILFDLFRVPFNEGRGGIPELLPG
ncbi:MAG: hypothetical protein HYR88_02250, partial [Verrucomicrobia bacterium]|nr:hypothetical protein [Verrucomicrobiota bacterium]